MARPLRIQYSGAYYHVMNRGNRREDILSLTLTAVDLLMLWPIAVRLSVSTLLPTF